MKKIKKIIKDAIKKIAAIKDTILRIPAIVFDKIKIILKNFYTKNQTAKPLKRILRLLSLLFFPFLVIVGLTAFFRWEALKKINTVFLFCMLIFSTWFVFGPFLVQNFIQEFMLFGNDSKLPVDVRTYFDEQYNRLFKIYIRYRFCYVLLFIAAAIVPILFYPFVLSKNILSGYHDWLFWLIILFLIWFISICMNGPAFISLISFHILSDLRKDKIFSYNPLLRDHRYAIKRIRDICGKLVRCMCTGLVFIPQAFFYFYQQPESITKDGQVIYHAAVSEHPIYIVWVVACLLLYAFFLFFFMTNQNMQIQDYSKSKGNAFLTEAQIKFIDINNDTKQPYNPLSAAAYRYAEHLKLEEIKLLCKTRATFDINTALTYFSSLVSLLTAIQGILKIIGKSAP